MNFHPGNAPTELLALIMTAVICFGSGCSSARRGAPVVQPIEPASAENRRGQVVFYRACNTCHVGGAAGLGPALNNKPLPNWLIRFQVRKGLGVMPAFSDQQISDKDLDALVSYLDTLKRADWPEAFLTIDSP